MGFGGRLVMAGYSATRSVSPAPHRDSQYERCPLCRAPQRFEPARFDLLSCAECGLVVSPDIWAPQIDEVVDQAWFGESWDPAASPWLRWFESIGNRRTFDRIGHAAGAGSLLEVGFGSGTFLAYMQARGWRVQGCDVSPSACRRAADRWSVPTHCGAVASLPRDVRYDAVVMNHILEHVQYPLEMLEEIRARMNPGGHLQVAVPNISCWEARLPGWIGYQPYHFTYFTRETLTDAVIRAGFNIASISTHEQFASWFQSIAGTMFPNMSGAARKDVRASLQARAGTSPIEHAYRATMVAFGAASWPFRRIQERLGRGDEVIVLARNFS